MMWRDLTKPIGDFQKFGKIRDGWIGRYMGSPAQILQYLERFGKIRKDSATFRNPPPTSGAIFQDLATIGEIWRDSARFDKIRQDLPGFGQISHYLEEYAKLGKI